MIQAIIYQPAKTAMQSGRAKTRRWKLEFTRTQPMTPDALMGWNTMAETAAQQLDLFFATAEEAVAYAQAKGLSYELRSTNAPRPAPKAYAENFSFARRKAFGGNQ